MGLRKVSRTGCPHRSAKEGQHTRMHTKKVLVVASDSKLRSTLAEALRSGGYGVFEAASGMEALERAGLDAPDLVLVDVHLDDAMDGWTTVKLLSESPRTESMPVVVVSDSERGGDLKRAALLGCRALVQENDPAAAVAAARAVLGAPQTDVPPETPPGVIRRRYRRRPVSTA